LNESFGFSKELDFQVLGNLQFLASIVGLAKDQGFFRPISFLGKPFGLEQQRNLRLLTTFGSFSFSKPQLHSRSFFDVSFPS